MHVCLLRGRERLPSLYLSSPYLQHVCVSLAGQLYHGLGPVHPGWGLCFLLLGPEEAKRHPRLPALHLFLQSHTVWQNCATRWHYCITNISQFIYQACLGAHTCSNVHYFFFYSYHTGSLAFGSLILSLVQVIRIVLEYLDRKLKGDLCNLENSLAVFGCELMVDVDDWLTGSSNAVSRFLICCLKCCFWCLEKFIRFMNRNAYIMVSSETTSVPLMFLRLFC